MQIIGEGMYRLQNCRCAKPHNCLGPTTQTQVNTTTQKKQRKNAKEVVTEGQKKLTKGLFLSLKLYSKLKILPLCLGLIGSKEFS